MPNTKGKRNHPAPMGKDYLPPNLAPPITTEYLYDEFGLEICNVYSRQKTEERIKDLHVPDNDRTGDIVTPQSFYVPHVASEPSAAMSNQSNLGDVQSPFAGDGSTV